MDIKVFTEMFAVPGIFFYIMSWRRLKESKVGKIKDSLSRMFLFMQRTKGPGKKSNKHYGEVTLGKDR